MKKEEKQALLALPIILIIAAGLALAGSQNGKNYSGIPIYGIAIALAFIIQWLAFIPAFLKKTESFFDLTGSITYILVTIISVILSAKFDMRSLILMVIIILWAARLGLFLFKRIHAAGEDRRFREIKTSFLRFLMTWTLQGLWVSFSLAAALAVITAQKQVTFDVFAIIGILVWAFGFGIEVIADRQKSLFKADPENKGRFIQSGLWSWSRHPNYFGEIVLWIGVAIITLPVLQGWQWLTLISPVFIILLLTRISGVPMLEKRADEKWGGQEDYESYKNRTSVLVLRPPSK
ncbi:MAG: DUF1295 domain-containing protein [Anaerolineaceae bacterium]|nr:DUF1295 domain-containing protein [Anaerolineaceae bacterium]